MARKRNQGSNWIRTDKRLAIYLRDGSCCAYCGRDASMGAVMTLDHVIACERGGTNNETNLITACRSCNSSKQDLTTRAWNRILRARGFDAAKIGRFIRSRTARDLKSYRRRAKLVLASLDGDFENTGAIALIAV